LVAELNLSLPGGLHCARWQWGCTFTRLFIESIYYDKLKKKFDQEVTLFYSTARFVKKGHLCFAGVITPTLVVAGVLGLEISTRWV